MKQFLLAVLLLNAAPSFAWLASADKEEITPDFARPVYLAGYGSKGRKATGVRDPIWARGMALSDGKNTAVLISLDLIGFPRPYVEKIRAKIPNAFLLLSSNHTHSGPDTLGLWGPKAGSSGVDPLYMDSLVDKISSLAARLIKKLENAQIDAATLAVDPKGLLKDIRDPVVIDNQLNVLRLVSVKTRKVLGVLANWSCHPEVLGKTNMELTGDFGSYFTKELERKAGGTAVFFAGSIGGLMTPDAAESNFAEAERIGRELSVHAMKALGNSVRLPEGRIKTASSPVRIPIENNLYLAFIGNVRHGRPLYTKSGALWKEPYWTNWGALSRVAASWIQHTLLGAEVPWIETEVSYISFGSVGIAALPGELFPELALGGYDGAFRFHHPLLSPGNPRPPILKAAPTGPYLKDLMPHRFRFIFGLSNDEIGYIVPPYDFKINKFSPVLSPRPKGHHYEETNSLGAQAAPLILEKLTELLR